MNLIFRAQDLQVSTARAFVFGGRTRRSFLRIVVLILAFSGYTSYTIGQSTQAVHTTAHISNPSSFTVGGIHISSELSSGFLAQASAPAGFVDLDGDGYDTRVDCDDDNIDINPGAMDIPGNGVDEDCDGEDATTSVVELGGVELRIFPNPTSDYIYIDTRSSLSLITEMVNAEGRLILSTNESVIDATAIPAGGYTLRVRIQNTDEQISHRIIITD